MTAPARLPGAAPQLRTRVPSRRILALAAALFASLLGAAQAQMATTSTSTGFSASGVAIPPAASITTPMGVVTLGAPTPNGPQVLLNGRPMSDGAGPFVLWLNGTLFQANNSLQVFRWNGSGWGDPVAPPIPGWPLAQAGQNAPAALADQTLPPQQAAKAGYTKQVCCRPFSSATVDVKASGKPGFDWYTIQWFGESPIPADQVTFNDDGSITVGGAATGVESAIPVNGGVNGNLFSHGAYFEATVKIDPTLASRASLSWPAFWAWDMRQVTSAAQWPGQPAGYFHWAEADFLEAFHSPRSGLIAPIGTIHDWSGRFLNGGWQFNISNNGPNVFKLNPVDNNWHRIGFLWVPQNGNTPGFGAWYIDDVLDHTQSWLGPVGSPPLDGQFTGAWIGQSQTYAITDDAQLSVIMTGDPEWPITVGQVRVFQRP